MADDDLELLRELLDTSEDEDLGEIVRGCKQQEVCVSGATNQATLRLKSLLDAPPNKRLRLTETANPLVAGKLGAAIEYTIMFSCMDPSYW